jgi:hypothetical protein
MNRGIINGSYPKIGARYCREHGWCDTLTIDRLPLVKRDDGPLRCQEVISSTEALIH